ncbi:hypothetical protein ACSVDE_08775 [Pseudalkalibacillus sp. Hm43]|uniref:hypothetical protein n=1 Tax=Pseudalkalibacillus sp. Hm43 TaxID=3450742 RepID=UPI003F440BC4
MSNFQLQKRLWIGSVFGSLLAFLILKAIWYELPNPTLLVILMISFLINFIISFKFGIK